jgi:hypothetical protein
MDAFRGGVLTDERGRVDGTHQLWVFFSFAFLPRGGLGGTETVSRVKRLVVTLSMGFLSFAPPQALSPAEGLGKGSARVGPRGGIWALLGIILSAGGL